MICVIVPVSVSVFVPEPETPVPVVPAETDKVPLVTDNVAVMLALPASTSRDSRCRAFERERSLSVAEYVVGVIVATGASLTAVILIVAESELVNAPPEPVLPLSLTRQGERQQEAGWRIGVDAHINVAAPLPASRLLMCVIVPVSVSVFVPEPETPAPVVPAETDKVPLVTDNVAVMLALPASTSEIAMPVPSSESEVCSVAEYVVGVIVATGASLTAAILIVAESEPVSAPPEPVLPLSLTSRVSVSEAGGVSELIR